VIGDHRALRSSGCLTFFQCQSAVFKVLRLASSALHVVAGLLVGEQLDAASTAPAVLAFSSGPHGARPTVTGQEEGAFFCPVKLGTVVPEVARAMRAGKTADMLCSLRVVGLAADD